MPLIEQKYKLRSILPTGSERVLYCDHVEGHGEQLFQLACDSDLEGIVAKRKFDPYIEKQAGWLKIRNTSYSQWDGREDLFERERESDPDFSLWDECVRACSDAVAWYGFRTTCKPLCRSSSSFTFAREP